MEFHQLVRIVLILVPLLNCILFEGLQRAQSENILIFNLLINFNYLWIIK